MKSTSFNYPQVVFYRRGAREKILAALLLTGSSVAMAQTTDELLNDGKNTENVLNFGMGAKVPSGSSVWTFALMPN